MYLLLALIGGSLGDDGMALGNDLTALFDYIIFVREDEASKCVGGNARKISNAIFCSKASELLNGTKVLETKETIETIELAGDANTWPSGCFFDKDSNIIKFNAFSSGDPDRENNFRICFEIGRAGAGGAVDNVSSGTTSTENGENGTCSGSHFVIYGDRVSTLTDARNCQPADDKDNNYEGNVFSDASCTTPLCDYDLIITGQTLYFGLRCDELLNGEITAHVVESEENSSPTRVLRSALRNPSTPPEAADGEEGGEENAESHAADGQSNIMIFLAIAVLSF